MLQLFLVAEVCPSNCDDVVEDTKYVDRQLCQIDKYVDRLYRGNLRPY